MSEFHGNQYTDNEYDDYGYDDLVADVRSLGAELGRSPTTRDARDSDALPCLDRIYDLADDWNSVLLDAGLSETQVEQYDDREAMVTDLREVHDRVGGCLTTRAYGRHGNYATSTIKKTFGSWRVACAAADVEPGHKYGTRCVGPNGADLESRHEQAVAQFLADNDIEYDVHPRVPGTDLVCDFYLHDDDLWVEVDGFPPEERPNEHTFEQKLSYYEDEGMEYLVVDGATELETKLIE